jgi:anti-anti-sigma factor
MSSLTVEGTKDRLLLSPQEALLAGGPAEELERRIQDVFKSNYQHLVIDLRGVPTIDSAGIRALVRGQTTAQRLNRRVTLVSPNPKVRETLKLSLLTNVLEVVDTLVEARAKTIPWDRIWTGIAVAIVGGALVGVGVRWPDFGVDGAPSAGIPGVPGTSGGGVAMANPVFDSSWPSSWRRLSSACWSRWSTASTDRSDRGTRRSIRRRCCCACRARS